MSGPGQRRILIIVLCVVAAYWTAPAGMRALGRFLVSDDEPPASDAVVVLNTGLEIYPRLIEAAYLFREGKAANIIINGDRKNQALRTLEAMGLQRGCAWDDLFRRVLGLLGVPQERIVSVSAEDAFDTLSEARAVVPELLERGYRQVIVTTSRFHTRRAGHIWRQAAEGRLELYTVAARTDTYQPDGWWHDGRQVRWVMAEYGGWLFLYWNRWFAG